MAAIQRFLGQSCKFIKVFMQIVHKLKCLTMDDWLAWK